MAKIVTVYTARVTRFVPRDMSVIRWLKISQALARIGHQVDIATNEPAFRLWGFRKSSISMAPNLRRVPLSGVRWEDYDVVKTLFHKGFEVLEQAGGAGHPFIISKLGSVVGSTNRPGIYFYDAPRERLFAVQQRIATASRFVTVLSRPAMALWREAVGGSDKLLLVPGGVDREIPPPRRDPYPRSALKRCLFAGNIYSRTVQAQAHEVLVAKLNRLGQYLAADGVRLYFLGTGDVDRLDGRYVTNLGSVPYEACWDYLYFADVGTVVAAGPFMHNNESTKIYHYLRAGLPVVSEAGFPNDYVVRDAQLGHVVENGNLELMASRIVASSQAEWDRQAAIAYILQHHTWDRRVALYDAVLKQHLPGQR